ncbi:Ppx/GppA phosphatase family protein [Pedobacter endophyticus]|uniref:Exopolyphosphatase n=1 Tax=Pedobacter endophyticus TaxID=2789740 RepID=A0A7S9PZ57_9SPHI|nr:exopolyphosphatase [Pedobacter endophyticus]QPH39590.1 exopolyphosphatase [Pedobacter endophyticus]
MRIAAIDLGTNTFHLLIAEVGGANINVLFKTNVPVKLGEGRINENVIIPAAFERGISCLKDFNSKIIDFGVDTVVATATSAVRSAQNGQEFVAAAKAEANISIAVISGDEEAELIYKGVKLSGAVSARSLIMDIGGGSVEFILCDEDELIWKKSYNIGAARLMQQFFKTDPISDNDKNAILFHIQNELADLFEIAAQFQPTTLIGSAGAFETFAELIERKHLRTIDLANLKTYQFNFDDYIAISLQLLNATHQQRAEMPGMIPLRIDMVMMATLITNYVLGRLKINNLVLSTYDLKMGIIANALNNA